jgi:ATP-dependent DNA helicase RecQ
VVRRFVESEGCRHLQICSHFGETAKWKSCGACDVCGATPPWLSEAVQAQKPKRRAAAAAAAGSNGVLRIAVSPRAGSTTPDADRELHEYLREWRRTTARAQGIAAFIVMHDTSLAELCRVKPRSLSELRRVSGFGDRKTELYGQDILDALGRFRNGARAAEAPGNASNPAGETLKLLQEGRTLEEIAQARGRQLSSVVSMVAAMVERGEVDFEPGWIHGDHQEKIEQTCKRLGMERLKPLKDALPEEVTYDEIRLVLACLRRQQDNS